MELVDFFGREYGWTKDETLQLTNAEVETLRSVIDKRRIEERRRG